MEIFAIKVTGQPLIELNTFDRGLKVVNVITLVIDILIENGCIVDVVLEDPEVVLNVLDEPQVYWRTSETKDLGVRKLT
jgi:hypothetical protein